MKIQNNNFNVDNNYPAIKTGLISGLSKIRLNKTPNTDIFERKTTQVCFTGDVISFPKNEANTESGKNEKNDYLRTIDGQIEWADWANLQLKCKNSKVLSSNIGTILHQIEDMDTETFYDKLIIKSYENGEDEKVETYSKKMLKLINKLQAAGASAEYCEVIREIFENTDVIKQSMSLKIEDSDEDTGAISSAALTVNEKALEDGFFDFQIKVPMKDFNKKEIINMMDGFLSALEENLKDYDPDQHE